MPHRPGSPAVKFMTSGTYQRATIAQTGLSYTNGTEFEVTDVSTNICAGVANQDEMFSWIRAKLYVGHAANPTIYEYALIKCLGTDATQDLDSSTVMEALQKESRIFKRELVSVPIHGYASIKLLSFELFNVTLRSDEELRLLIRPVHGAAAGATGFVVGLLEWRKVGT